MTHLLHLITVSLQDDSFLFVLGEAKVSDAPGWEVQGLSPIYELLLCQLVLNHELCQVSNHLCTKGTVTQMDNVKASGCKACASDPYKACDTGQLHGGSLRMASLCTALSCQQLVLWTVRCLMRLCMTRMY